MNFDEPWATVEDIPRIYHHAPMDAKLYDFADLLMAAYRATPADEHSRYGLTVLLSTAFLAGEISGKRKERVRRKKGVTE